MIFFHLCAEWFKFGYFGLFWGMGIPIYEYIYPLPKVLLKMMFLFHLFPKVRYASSPEGHISRCEQAWTIFTWWSQQVSWFFRFIQGSLRPFLWTDASWKGSSHFQSPMKLTNMFLRKDRDFRSSKASIPWRESYLGPVSRCLSVNDPLLVNVNIIQETAIF